MQVSGFRIYFLEPGYFFSKILSEFRKKIVALHLEKRKELLFLLYPEDEIYFEYLSDSDMTGEKLEEKLYDANIWRE